MKNLREECLDTAKLTYGDPLPPIVSERLERELAAIGKNRLIEDALQLADCLRFHSLTEGRTVSFRGTIGSSLVAYLLGLTWLDPLPPHFCCESGHFSDFIDDGSVASCDVPPQKPCPLCGEPLTWDGEDLPFEMAFGLAGERMLSIQMEICPEAREMLEGTAFDWLRERWPERGEELWDCIRRGAKIPEMTEIVSPEGERLLSLIESSRQAMDSAWDVRDVPSRNPFTNERIWALFGNPEECAAALGLPAPRSRAEAQIRSERVGTLGLPGFLSRRVLRCLFSISCLDDLVQIMGLALGVGTWEGAEFLLLSGCRGLDGVIASRDQLFLTLVRKGLSREAAYAIMMRVSFGGRLTEKDLTLLREAGFDKYFFENIEPISYLWPKADLINRACDAIEFAYRKTYHAVKFYAAYFTAHAEDFDAEIARAALAGRDALRRPIAELWRRLDDRECEWPEERFETLCLADELLARGFAFLPPEEGKSDETRFLIEGNALRLPLRVRKGENGNG